MDAVPSREGGGEAEGFDDYDGENIQELDNNHFEVTVARFDLDLAEQEQAKLYLEVESLTDIPRCYRFTDAVELRKRQSGPMRPR